VFNKALEIFEKLGGMKNTEYLSEYKFLKLSRLEGMQNDKISKEQYPIMFKNAANKNRNNKMDFTAFLNSFEILQQKFNFNHGKSMNFNELLKHILTCLNKAKST
jgi:hypothetical protein